MDGGTNLPFLTPRLEYSIMNNSWVEEWRALLLVGGGGALGSMARHLCGFAARCAGLPAEHSHFSTLAINVFGSLLAGWLLRQFGPVNSTAFLLWGLGFCGGFTTFSSYSREIVMLLRDDRWLEALLYGVLSVALGVGGFIIGWALGSFNRGTIPS